MNYSGDLAIALDQLQTANVAYYKRLKRLRECKEARSKCYKDFQRFKGQSSATDSMQKALDEATLAQEAAEKDLGCSRTDLRMKQRAYDKLRRSAMSERKAQKESKAREQKQREKEKEQQKEGGKKQKKQRHGSSRKFLRDDYEESESESPRQPRMRGKPWRRPNAEAPTSPSEWKLACDKALRDRATMTSFPDPPSAACGLVGCATTRSQRALSACPCNIAAALQRDPEYPESLRLERLRWHPDKFSVCGEEHRAEFQAKAKEIFVVANHLYERDGKASGGGA